MADQTYRANLSAAVFPMTVSRSGKSVIIPGPDNNFDRRIDSPGDTPRGSVSIPQVIYGENILPTPDGIQSVGFINCTALTLAGSSVAAMVAARIATAVITENTVSTVPAETLFTDSGNQLNTWNKSTPLSYYNGGDDQGSLDVDQITSDGNPQPSYRFISLVLGGGGPSGGYDFYLNRQFAIGDPNNLGFEFDFEFFLVPEKSIMMGVANTAAGSGLKVYLNNQTGVETLKIGTATSWADYAGFSSYVSVAISPVLAAGTQYRLELTAVRTTGDTRLITATIKNGAGTVLFTTNTTQVFIPDNYFGVGSKYQYNTGSDIIFDNIEITGDGLAATSTTTNTEFTGITTAYLAFLANNTVKWSYDLATWDNHATTLPGGFLSPASPAKISVATVRGQSYVCVRQASTTKIYLITVDTGTNIITFTDISATIGAALPNPYTIDSILGIVGSYNYLVLYGGGIIIWSSTTTPTDFAPSLVSGAGNEVPGNLKGDITFCREHVSGFFIYSTKNVVFAQYTGNARYPWKFREVSGSGGYNYSTQVSGDTNSAVQYGINNTKLIQILSPDNAELVAQEATDFIERTERWDKFDSGTFTFSLSNPLYPLMPASRITAWFFLDRYLLLPYGGSNTEPSFQWTYVIVYDSLLKRYGKLAVTFDYCLSDEEAIYFINRTDGTIKTLEFNINRILVDEVSDGRRPVIVLGKFQYVRSRFLTLSEINVEAIQSTDVILLADREFQVAVLPTLDGKTFLDAVIPENFTAVATKEMYNGLCHVSCHNFALVFSGAFDLNTVELVFHVDGDN
jgi:hypothetical protein